jgi:murein DD-endopeptidase MepM/ murein hydrolase activator NlpD
MNVNPTGGEMEFRLEIERADRYSIFDEAIRDTDVVFFAPVIGTLTDGYSPKSKHFAVDIAVESNTPVKSVADGTVIFAEWTATTGHVIIIEHNGGFISVYKHNTSLHKEQGDFVKSGEVIASAGNTGELSTGPHLHFELWSGGYPVNPTYYIDFE